MSGKQLIEIIMQGIILGLQTRVRVYVKAYLTENNSYYTKVYAECDTIIGEECW